MKKPVDYVIDELVENGMSESTIVEVRNANNCVKWRGRADNYPVYLSCAWFIEVMSHENGVLIIKADI